MTQNNQSNNNVPEWAAYFTEKQFEKFLSLIDNYFQANNIPYSREDNEITINSDVENSTEWNVIRLGKPARLCREFNEHLWKEIIDDYFETVNRMTVFEEGLKEHCGDFTFFQPYLTVKLYDFGTGKIPNDFGLYYHHGDGKYAEVIFDFPDYRRPVYKKDITDWGKSEREVVLCAMLQYLDNEDRDPARNN